MPKNGVSGRAEGGFLWVKKSITLSMIWQRY